MLLPSGLKSVPRRMLSICEKIVAVTDDVCDRHLNQEYCELARMMTEALCRKRPSPLTSGQPRTWAAGIVYVLGRGQLSDLARSRAWQKEGEEFKAIWSRNLNHFHHSYRSKH